MPPLEINQSHYINASVRLDEPIAGQFTLYAAFARTSADDFVDKALDYVLSNDCDLADFLKMPRPNRLTVRCVSVKAQARMRVSIQGGGLWWCENGASHRKKGGHVTPKLGTAKRCRAPKCLQTSTCFG